MMQLRSTTRRMKQEEEVGLLVIRRRAIVSFCKNNMNCLNNKKKQLSYCDKIRLFHELFYMIYDHIDFMKKDIDLQQFVFAIKEKIGKLIYELLFDIVREKREDDKHPDMPQEDIENRKQLLTLICDVYNKIM